MNNTTASNFPIEKFGKLVRELRNARRAVTSMVGDRNDNQKKEDSAKEKLQKALDEADLELITTYTAELKRAMRKLAENPEERELAFQKTLEALRDFLSVLDVDAPDGKGL